ncbi:MAG: hypothetical protein A2049_01780 [Elusimicrobia bacterium GWA2_62_23]|nr:MAG: hypothetical protein A2049_01780 [Elusimicrobia bacterium GWA2_62_23]
MEFIKPSDDMSAGLLAELVAGFREQACAEKAAKLESLAVKLHGLVADLLDAPSPKGFLKTYAKARFLVGTGKGNTATRTLKEICSVSENGSASYTEEDALNIIAFDVSQKVFDYVRKRYEDHPHADAPFGLNEYIVKKCLDPIRLGRRAVSDMFYSYKWGVGGGTPTSGDDEELIIEPPAVGETPEEQLAAKSAREHLSAIAKAIVCAMRQLRSLCEKSFNYLLALTEATLILRAMQAGRAFSDKTETIHQDMSPLFVAGFLELGAYNHEQYKKVFDKHYDPFIQVDCAGTTKTVRTRRSRARDRLLALFRPLLAAALRADCAAQDVKIVLKSVCKWLKKIKWQKPGAKVTL